MEDETIVELLYRRDEGALEELEGKYGPGLLRLAGSSKAGRTWRRR